ncbi:MAG: DUF4331 family protein [Polyangiaceae bacterium]
MRKTWLLGGVLTSAVLAAALGYTTRARSADHLDAPATTAEPAADINDVFSWTDGSNVILAMTVYPNAAPGTKFSDSVQYVFHTQSGAAYGATTATEKDIIATFDAAGKIQLWVGSDEYVTGDASATTGLSSADGKVKVFAGLRADPFFFNLSGFKAAVATVDSLEEAGTIQGFGTTDAGCPLIPTSAGATLRNLLSKNPADGGVAQNDFAAFNALSIVVAVDKSLVNSGGPITAIWGSTHNGS